jgi:signal transduction histidine kinase
MPGAGRTFREWLFPRMEADDERFRLEVQNSSRMGLRLLSAHAVLIPPLLWLARFQLVPAALTRFPAIAPPATIAGLGVLAFGLGEVRRFRPHARKIASVLAFLIAAVLIGFVLFGSANAATPEHRLAGYLCLLMLVTIIAVPLRPAQAFALGLSIDAWYLLCSTAAGERDVPEALFLFALTVIAAALAAAVYAHRIVGYRSREQALRINEYLCLAQSRVLLSENAASLGRLAATLVHELNTPLGALASAVDALIALSAKQRSAPPQDQERLLTLQADLRKSIRSSLERLEQTVSRIDHLTALDETDFQSLDVNELLKDVAALVETKSKNKITVEFDLEPLPELTCQPQQLSAVFSNVLDNAAEAMNGCGSIRVATCRTDSKIEIRIQDCGRGISAEDLAHIFEPGFKVAGGRMSTGNWSLFSSRQIVHGHGGEMYMTSVEGKGSTVVIALPF